MRTLLGFCASVFCALAPTVTGCHVEVHQFRIEAALAEAGQPTPEGEHRDGVDYVMVLLVPRETIASGTTTIHTPQGQLPGTRPAKPRFGKGCSRTLRALGSPHKPK